VKAYIPVIVVILFLKIKYYREISDDSGELAASIISVCAVEESFWTAYTLKILYIF
jgi:hypothetical protein